MDTEGTNSRDVKDGDGRGPMRGGEGSGELAAVKALQRGRGRAGPPPKGEGPDDGIEEEGGESVYVRNSSGENECRSLELFCFSTQGENKIANDLPGRERMPG